MDLRIAGKKALMAGGSAGMGRATAERLAEAGVELYISARREERLIKAAKEISQTYATTVTPIVADSSTDEGRGNIICGLPRPRYCRHYHQTTRSQWRLSSGHA